MTFDILLVNSSSASTVTRYDKGIEQRGRAGAVRDDHRSLPRTFIIMARRCRQEPRPPSPLSRETVFFDETIRALSSSFETATDQRIFPEEK